ncbi:hypothetical protein ACX4ER_000946 [Cronobacter dublinensis]
MQKKPWERRLKDLAHLLNSCAATYFDPELFRLNLNQFLQTSRTVTFIIQKNKKDIKDFEEWYSKSVIDRWAADPIMTWAKDSRNIIEKQGDLEMFSEAKATLIFSHVERQDIDLSTKNEMLGIGVKRLVRLAQKSLPSGVSDAAVIKSERRWVANTLREYELLHALTIIYSRVYDCCKSLGLWTEHPLDNNIVKPAEFDLLRNETRRVTFLKLKNLSTGIISIDNLSYSSSALSEIPKDKIRSIYKPPSFKSIYDLVEHMAKIAEINFLRDGTHVQSLFLISDSYEIIDLISTKFEDQADKYIFWRYAAERAKMLNAYGFVWVSELWLRRPKKDYSEAIHKMPIIGEQLQLVGVDCHNNQKNVTWNIVRDSADSMPKLTLLPSEEKKEGRAYFMRSLLQAIGADVSMLNE